MERKIAIFGPAKVGKSTLAGYTYANRTPGFNLKNEFLRVRKKLGEDYEEKSKYAQLVDTLPDEVLRPHGRGTTLIMKTIVMQDHEMTIIDTPGAEHRYRERAKGMYYGDIGVFMVELKHLTKRDLLDKRDRSVLENFFAPLCLWYGFKDEKRNEIVVISKMDTGSGFSEEEFNKAAKIIKNLCRDETIEIIPISIIVDEDRDHNVLRKSEKLRWYSGPTLWDRLCELKEELPTDEISEPLFSIIDKKFNPPGTGGVIEVKILQGTLIKGSEVKITPVKLGKEIHISGLTNIKSIEENKEAIEIAETGSIVGLKMDSITTTGKRHSKKDFFTVESSCIVDPHTPMSMGNVLQFKISSGKTEKFPLSGSVMILWFGKFVSSRVVRFNDEIVTLELDSKGAPMVSLPLDNNNKFIFDEFILQTQELLIPRKNKDEEDVYKYKFTSVTLEKLGVPRTLTLSLKNINTKKEYIENYFKDFKYDMDTDKIIFYSDGSLINLVRAIKQINVGLIGETKDIFPNINIEIKELKEM